MALAAGTGGMLRGRACSPSGSSRRGRARPGSGWSGSTLPGSQCGAVPGALYAEKAYFW